MGERDVEIRQVEHGTPDYEALLVLRMRLLNKPVGVTYTEEMIRAEAADTHIGAFLEGKAVGVLVLSPREGGLLQMRQVAVEENLRGLDIGRKLVEFAEEAARGLGYSALYLHARKTAVGFYQRLDYTAEEGEYLQVGIPHRKMHKTL